MPLYGHEMNLEVNPFEAGFGKVVRLDKPGDFVGKAALTRLSETKPQRVLVGLKGEGKRSPRAEYQIFEVGSDSPVGEITSGALSPTLGYPVAMAYVSDMFSETGTRLEVDIRGTRLQVDVVSLPFYKRGR
jgi:aminomethyltransferase